MATEHKTTPEYKFERCRKCGCAYEGMPGHCRACLSPLAVKTATDSAPDRTRRKYVVIPGHIVSRHDGGWHYVSAEQLMHLYRVRPEECTVYDHNKYAHFPTSFYDEKKAEWLSKGMIILAPRFDGKYIPPEQ